KRLGRPRGLPRSPGAPRGGPAHGRQPLHLRGERDAMTETARRLRRLGAPHARARALAAALAGVGAALAVAAAGVQLAPAAIAVTLAWIVMVAVAAMALRLAARAARARRWGRGRGEAGRAEVVPLGAQGRAARRLGPLEHDLFLRASSGGRRSAEVRVAVALPAFLAALEITARFPPYLDRPDEPVLTGVDTVTVPEGTTLVTRGAASVLLRAAAWTAGPSVVALRVDGSAFAGALTPRAGGAFALGLLSREGLRAAARDATQALASAADSVSAEQRRLADRTADLAQQRSRESPEGGDGRETAGRQAGALPFEASQRAEALARQQAAVSDKVRELAQAVEEVARAAAAAGVTDSAFQ